MILIEAFERWGLAVRPPAGTLDRYRRGLWTLARYGIEDVDDVSREVLALYQDARLQLGRSPRTINGEINGLFTLLWWLESRGQYDGVKIAQLRRVRLPMPQLDPPDYYTRAEFYRICLAAPDWLRFPFELAVFTGPRVGELHRLEVDDVDLEARVLRIRRRLDLGADTKAHRDRVVSLCPEALEVLRRNMPASGYLFATRHPLAKAPYVSIDALENHLRALGRQLGIHTTFHRCRRTFTTWMLQADVPAEDVARMLGHTRVDMLYRHYYGWIARYNPAVERLQPPAAELRTGT